MDRRAFCAYAIAAVPLAALRPAALDRTDVTVTHDGDKPLQFTVVGTVVRDNRAATYSAHEPLKLTTPAAFMVDVASSPAVITAAGTEFVRVTADHPSSAQHVMGHAPIVTIRRRASESASVMIELVGEPKGKP